MAFSLAARPLAIALAFFLLLLPPSFLAKPTVPDNPILINHGGPILSGNLNLALIWYGNVGRVQKNAIRNFIKSLNYKGGKNLGPQVSTWWNVVESYQPAAAQGGKPPRITVTVVKQISDLSHKYGKVLTADYIPKLVSDVTAGNPNVIPIILTSRQITVSTLCTGKCGDHSVVGNQPYVIVGNPETECPAACAWPFYKSDQAPQGVVLQPPSGNIGADAMVVALAGALAEMVTNPQNTGYYLGIPVKPVGAAQACKGIFGSGALPGSTGKVLIDPKTGVAFNAYGNKGKQFLLPAIWNPKTRSCWTLL